MGNAGIIIIIAVVAVIFVACTFVCVPIIVASLVDDSVLSSAISETIERLHGLNFEAEVVMGGNGEIFSETTQYSTEFVHQTNEQIAMFKDAGDLIGIHNHVEDIPPSMRDLLYAAEADFAQIIVVTPRWVYRISRPDTGWEEEAKLNDAMSRHLELFKGRQVEKPVVVAIESDGAVVESECYEIASTDDALEAVCRDLGYIITKEEV